jgi:S1-C subfamily serine protease
MTGSPAEKAGLVASTSPTTVDGLQTNVGGDVITAIDAQPVKKINDLIAYLTTNTSVGQKVTLTVLRGGKEIKVDVTLGERPAQTQTSQSAPQSGNPIKPFNRAGSFLGVSGLAVDTDIIKAMNLPAGTSGILVVAVQKNSPAAEAGLKGGSKPALVGGKMTELGGDVITAINGQALTSVEDLRSALAQTKPNEKVTLSILRDGVQQEISVTLSSR